MSTLLFDIETDGLLDKVTKIHCIVIKDIETGDIIRCRANATENQQTIDIGLLLIQAADEIWGHNIVRFDIPVIQKFYPWFKPRGKIRDTLVIAKLLYPNLKVLDAKARVKDFPKQLTGRHSLEAWGYRLGAHKGTYGKTTDWKEFTEEMLEYCVQDVAGPTEALYKLILKKAPSEEAVQVEHDFTRMMHLQELHGFRFDEPAAHALHATLVKRRLELQTKLTETFKGWWEDMKTPECWGMMVFDPMGVGEVKKLGDTKIEARAALKAKGKKGKEIEALLVPGPMAKKHTPFNPASRDHIARVLKEAHGWVPNVFTDGGKPQVDESVLEGMEFPEAKLLLESLMLDKRLGSLAEGDNAWLKLVTPAGRMHGQVDSMGTVTSRCSHSKPNMGQVVAVDKPYGKEMRALFIPNEGHVLVGADASGIQLRALSHYLARWDGGEYARLVSTGDVHTANREAAPEFLKTRDMAKTFIYAYLLGGGDRRLGEIVGKGAAAGKELKRLFIKKFPAFQRLKDQLEVRVRESKSITGLDGRLMPCDNAHFGLASLLQGFEAVVMKKATWYLYDELTGRQWAFVKDWGFCAMVHDEWQMSSRKDIADEVGKAAVAAIKKAGEHFGSKCPLAGEYKIGANWKETH